MQCSFCDSPLKDDARYCNQCGTLVASHPFSPKSSFAVGASDKAGRAGCEQIAAQHDRAARRLQDEPPSWLSHLPRHRPGTTRTLLVRIDIRLEMKAFGRSPERNK